MALQRLPFSMIDMAGASTALAPYVNPQFTAPYLVAVTRPSATKLADSISIKDIGAVGDGVTDDTLAFQKAYDCGRNIWIPAGTYRITQDVTYAGAICMVGEGPYRSRLLFDGCNGFLVTGPQDADPFATTQFESLAFLTTRDSAGWGLRYYGDLSGFGKQLLVRNCLFAGATPNKSWYKALLLNAGSGSEITGCFFLGRHDSNVSYENMAAAIQLENLSTDVRITNNWIYFAQIGVHLDGTSVSNAGEGINICKNHIVLARYGVWARQSTGNMLDIEGNHIAAMERGVVLGADGVNGCNHSFVHDNFIMKRADSSFNYVGIECYGARCKIHHNELAVEGNSAGGIENQIVVGGYYTSIDHNNVWDADNSGIWVRSTADHTSVIGNTGANNATNIVIDAPYCTQALNTFDDQEANRGALIHKAGTTAIPTGGAYTVVTFNDVQHNSNNLWDGTSRIVIPAGVKRVRLEACVRFATTGTPTWHKAAILKNGNDHPGMAIAQVTGDGPMLTLRSGEIDVNTGDSFEVNAATGAAGSVNVTPFSWFQISVIN